MIVIIAIATRNCPRPCRRDGGDGDDGDDGDDDHQQVDHSGTLVFAKPETEVSSVAAS
jgi:hypothetical protein